MTDHAAPGWTAIDAALRPLYGDTEPRHFGTIMRWRVGGSDPLDGVSAYRRDDHWHYVSYGMTELYDKESDRADESGWGFEFTIRVARPAGEQAPPHWPIGLLQNIGRYVFRSGNTFGVGHHMNLNGPISSAATGTLIRAVAFTDDPELPPIETPHGAMRFLQVVGLTLAEYEAVEAWRATAVLAVLEPYLPLLVTDLDRRSLTDEPAVAAAIAEGSRRDGSSTGSLYVQEARGRREHGRTTLTVGANAAPRIARVLANRLPFGRDLAISSPDGTIRLRPGAEFSVTGTDDGLDVTIPPDVAGDVMAALVPRVGERPVGAAPGLTISVVRSQIRGQNGEVLEEVG
jgi:hypothetical protein